MEWNCDGNHDWKDDAFYNNVVSEECEKNGDRSNGSCSSGESSFSHSSVTWFVVLCVICFLIKLFT